jgi:hypothetical protein
MSAVPTLTFSEKRLLLLDSVALPAEEDWSSAGSARTDLPQTVSERLPALIFLRRRRRNSGC